MLHGGLWAGTLNLVRGFPGTGKSALASHFLDAGLKRGEPCLMVSLGSSPARIRAQVASLGMAWDLALETGRMRLLHYQTVGLVYEQMLNEIVAAVREQRPRRLVLDSIDDVAMAVRDDDAVRDFLQVLATLVEVAGTAAMLLEESSAAGGVAAEGRLDNSGVASCALQLSLVEDQNVVRRYISVRKHAGSDHAKALAEYIIDSGGMRVGAPAPRDPPREG
jgi:circadian clock protein KaiC